VLSHASERLPRHFFVRVIPYAGVLPEPRSRFIGLANSSILIV
jgi:hypothetical protein